MPEYHDRATANPATASRGIPNSGTAPASALVSLKVSRHSSDQDVLKSLEKVLGISSRTVHETLKEYDDFLSQVSSTLADFRKRSDKQFVTLYFTLQEGVSWAGIRRSPNLLYKYVRIRHELQLGDDRQRLEQERRDEAEKARATADRLAQETVREQKRQAAAEKVKQMASKIAGETMFWTNGMVMGRYLNGDFQVWYTPISKHGNTDLAIEQANSAEHRQKLERALWDAYHQPGDMLTIYSIPEPTPDLPPPPAESDSIADECSDPDLINTNPHAYIKCGENRAYYGGMLPGVMKVTEPLATGFEAANPADPINLLTGPAIGIASKIAGKAVPKVLGAVKKAVRATKASIYATRWGKAGAELIERAISEAGTIRNYYGKLPANNQVHHLVPVTLLKKSEVVQAAVVNGFEFNAKVNTIALPRTVHMAYHNKYIELISDRLEKWAADHPGFTPRQARDFLEKDRVGIYDGGLVEEWRRNWHSVL